MNACDSGNRTALMLAAKFGNQPLIDLFLEFGAKKSVEDSNSKLTTAKSKAVTSLDSLFQQSGKLGV